MSGNPDVVQCAQDGYLQVLQKPFRLTELAEAVETAIASGRFGHGEAQR